MREDPCSPSPPHVGYLLVKEKMKMKALLHGVASRLTPEAGSKKRATNAAELQMLRREQDRAYWADWRSNPSPLAEIHAMYVREGASTLH